MGSAKDEVLRVRVKPSGAAAFRAECARRGLSTSDALRQAVTQWTDGLVAVGPPAATAPVPNRIEGLPDVPVPAPAVASTRTVRAHLYRGEAHKAQRRICTVCGYAEGRGPDDCPGA